MQVNSHKLTLTQQYAVGYQPLGTCHTVTFPAEECHCPDASTSSSRVGFNVPQSTLQVISGTIFTGQMTQRTVSSTEGQHVVSAPGKGLIPPVHAFYKVKVK